MNKFIAHSIKTNEFDDLRFDWYSALDTKWFDDLENEVIDHVDANRRSTRGLSKEQRAKRDASERYVFNQIISALYQAYFQFPIGGKTVSIQLKEKAYTGSRFSHTAVSNVFKSLLALNLINRIEGKQSKFITRMYPNKRLELFFESLGLRWAKQQPNPPETIVVLRDLKHPNTKNPKLRKKKIDLPVPETKKVLEARQNLYRINSFITEHCISLDLEDAQLIQLSNIMAKRKRDEDGNPIEDEESARKLNLFNVQLRRIFSRGSLKKGGRFYGGWWQGIPSLYRPHILIDGYKVAEVDYGTISLRILYAQRGIDVPLEQDLYNIGLDDWRGKEDRRRDAIKTYINAALNDEQDYYQLSEEDQVSTGLTHKQLKEMVATAHQPIADVFNSGIGLDTQFIDSQIAEQVMLRMADEGQVVLPIHDSFIVRLGYEYRLREVMLEVFKEVVGKEGKVSADYPRLKQHFGLEQSVIDEENNDPSIGIVNLNEMGEEFFSDSLMNRFAHGF
jgi:hypothetical protein